MTPDAFVARWRHADGSELANAQSFVRELCELLGVPPPDPARAETRDNAYVFERRVVFRHGDGSTSEGRIDCYRRAAFVLEAKKLKPGVQTRGFDDGMLRARAQGENYARALPADEGRPPFLIVLDVGRVIELYAEFSRSGATYTPFPDPRGHRIRLEDLRDAAVRERLRRVWLDPLALDPARVSARVTRDIAQRLADIARALEAADQDPEAVAGFLTRCLFCFFAEDVGLLPRREGRGAFTALLEDMLLPSPAGGRGAGGEGALPQFVPLVGEVWRAMDAGGFSVALRAELPRFNGKLFKDPQVLPLARGQIELLIAAGRADWAWVEPAIFGTLLEAALDPRARHDLGAHYTPRAYVERLVLPTVIEPLRAEWADAKAAALVLAAEGKADAARAALHAYHHRLCHVRVLDPACGSGNFLYVGLEHMKRLEGEVLDLLDQMGDTQGRLEAAGLTVDPHQFLGLEVNPRAAAIAEMVLWIGYLQWHFRTRGSGLPPTPILRDFHNIRRGDALLAYDGVEYATDADGRPVTHWDGRTTRPHPATGEPVPDETARVPLERYLNPRPADWPAAEFAVGNPPFIGAASMRQALGDGYVEALRGVYNPSGAGGEGVPDSADFVLYWWHRAAALTRAGRLRRFGFITTNSIRQTFNRRVLEGHLSPTDPVGRVRPAGRNPTSEAEMSGYAALTRPTGFPPSPQPSPSRGEGENLPSPLRGEGPGERVGMEQSPPLHLAYAIPDHPWVDAADGAAVRIAMTVGAPGEGTGRLASVVEEGGAEGDAVRVVLAERIGRIHADLSIGADVAGARALRANAGISQRGLELGNSGFIVTPDEAVRLLPSPAGGGAGGEGTAFASAAAAPSSGPAGHLPPEGEGIVRPYRNGRDLTDRPRGVLVVDPYGLTEAELRRRHPAVWQWLHERVKPERDHNRDEKLRQHWWLHRRLREDLRAMLAGLPRYIATVETAKHRVFQFLDAAIAPDNMLVCIALADAWHLGVLSSRAHVAWALAAGGTLEDRPRYNKTRCFDTFPFPDASPERQARIRALAEELDAHRKRRQAEHPELTLTGMYNCLDKLRAGEALTARDREVHERGLVAVLRELHDELDAAVLAAYGWDDLLPSPAGGRGAGGEGAWFDSDALLDRLAALNAERRREEAAGRVRWLRPEFQCPASLLVEAALPAIAGEAEAAIAANPAPTEQPTEKRPWPAALPEQVATVARILAETAVPLDEPAIAARFTGKGPWKKRLPQLLDTLVALGRARRVADGYAGEA